MSLSYHMILLNSAWRKDAGPHLSLAANLVSQIIISKPISVCSPGNQVLVGQAILNRLSKGNITVVEIFRCNRVLPSRRVKRR